MFPNGWGQNSAWIQSNSALVQALGTLLLLVVTGWYAVLTSKLVHVNYKAILNISQFEQLSDKAFEIFVYNHGPGIASNVTVNGEKVFDENCTIECDSMGHFIIKNGYLLPDCTSECVVVISWYTLSGQKQYGKWLLIEKGYQIILLDNSERTTFTTLKVNVQLFFRQIVIELIKKIDEISGKRDN